MASVCKPDSQLIFPKMIEQIKSVKIELNIKIRIPFPEGMKTISFLGLRITSVVTIIIKFFTFYSGNSLIVGLNYVVEKFMGELVLVNKLAT